MELARKLLGVRTLHVRRSAHAEGVIRYAVYSLLALAIVWAAWQFWATLRGPVRSLDPMSRAAPAVIPTAAPEDNIATMHLFGAESLAALQPAVRDDAVVVGIVHALESQASRAILVINGAQQSYAVGSMLPGGARVVSIEQTQVVLDHNGERYALTLEHRLADQNADFGSLWPPAAAVNLVDPGPVATATAGAGVSDGAMGLEARRQNLTVPPPALAGKLGQGTRARAIHRRRVLPKSD